LCLPHVSAPEQTSAEGSPLVGPLFVRQTAEPDPDVAKND
jgi:hypothetical protein